MDPEITVHGIAKNTDFILAEEAVRAARNGRQPAAAINAAPAKGGAADEI